MLDFKKTLSVVQYFHRTSKRHKCLFIFVGIFVVIVRINSTKSYFLQVQ
jgi:hypothetical protein